MSGYREDDEPDMDAFTETLDGLSGLGSDKVAPPVEPVEPVADEQILTADEMADLLDPASPHFIGAAAVLRVVTSLVASSPGPLSDALVIEAPLTQINTVLARKAGTS